MVCMKFVWNPIFCALLLVLALSSCRRREMENSLQALPSHRLDTEADLDVLINQIGNARIVLLGEASHGTAEYYDWRAALSRRLIAEKGFDLIGVEGEWADSYRVNQFVKGPAADSAQAVSVLRQYDRWPTWMWGNYHVASLATWMNNYNQGKAPADKAGFFGLDVYCLWESTLELMSGVQGNPALAQKAQQVYQCFRPYSADPVDYGYAVYNASASCRQASEELWQSVWSATGGTTARDESSFVLQQHALVARNAEQYYRTAVVSYPESWNIRDRHMMQTIERLLEHEGPDAKIIIWEHNTHIGDARHTDMADQGMVNVGQLVRERYGADQVFAIGFGSYSGSVIASPQWGGPIQSMRVPPAERGSWEELLHRTGAYNKILLSSELKQEPDLMRRIGNRAIGVVYDPGNESGNYVPSIIPNRYDAFVFIDRTSALRALGTPPRNEPPDTYPSGQ